jgi:antitoxin (DNA-binding transcriptional repressor) of toxin-antitoxin stability system
MARLPSEQYLMQQIGAQVILFEDFTEREVARFDPSDGIAAANALDAIQRSELSDEDKCYACFWAGYFHAYADPSPEMRRETYVAEVDDGEAVVVLDAGTPIVRFDPHDADAASKAQYPVYLSEKLSQDEKNRAHFWCGFFYARAS